MTNKIEIIYDDRLQVVPVIEAIVGKRRYGEVLHQKKRLFEISKQAANKVNANFYYIRDDAEFYDLAAALATSQAVIVYHRANAAIGNEEAYIHLLQKISYTKTNLANELQNPYLAVFADNELWQNFLNNEEFLVNADIIEVDYALTDISDSPALLSLLSGIFEARHFNALQGDNHIIVKSSNNIAKIHSEYQYHYLLPESLRYWFVSPFDYAQENDSASYKMERLHITNMALSWLHKAFDESEFDRFLARIFRFLNDRPARKTKNSVAELYIGKVESRYQDLKQHQLFSSLDAMVRSGVDKQGIDGIMQRYNTLAKSILKPENEAISHGDLCFSNILYDKQTNNLRLIDPRGAETEADLWLDSYYDIAKLSHSILGSYDFICYEQFSISVEEDLQLALKIHNENIKPLKNIFINRLREAGFDPIRVRLCEASLFLSMLPLHSDNFKRILAFILNANSIIGELEENVKR